MSEAASEATSEAMSRPIGESRLQYVRAVDAADAVALGSRTGATFVAGGTDLIQLLKSGVIAPSALIDISRLPLNDIALKDGELHLGALARLSDVAANRDVVRSHPLITQAIEASACGQVRNMASVGGNLLQRTRCVYFRTEGVACNKRKAGSGCGALAGENRQAALFGRNPLCVATHPSDLAVALAALGAEVEILGRTDSRRIVLTALYSTADNTSHYTPEQDTTLASGELITAVRIANAERFAAHSTYLKVRDRASFEFAVVSIAAALRLHDGVIVEARLAAGGVAARPWRLRHIEAALLGQVPNTPVFTQAAQLVAEGAAEGAQPLTDNRFKIDLLRNAIVRALETVGGQS